MSNIKYSEYIAESVDKSIDYAEYIAENLDKTIEYSEYIADIIDYHILYPNGALVSSGIDVKLDTSGIQGSSGAQVDNCTCGLSDTSDTWMSDYAKCYDIDSTKSDIEILKYVKTKNEIKGMPKLRDLPVLRDLPKIREI